jgi:DNA-binding response OmpR family regulator
MDVFITKLRKHLQYDSNVEILNVRGIGYKMIY